MKMMGLEERLKKDPRVKEFRLYVKMAIKDLDRSEQYMDEAYKIQVSRVKASDIHREVIANVQKKLTEVKLKNSAYRSRIAKMRANIIRLKSTLESGRKAMKRYISATYAVQFDAMKIKTKTDRDAWVDNYLHLAVDLIDRLETAMEVCNIVMDDIDSQSFAVKDVVNILTLEFKFRQPEG